MSDNDTSDDGRTEIESAAVDLFMADDDYPMVVPRDDDVRPGDLGRLVADRIEANGAVTLPDPSDRPDAKERQPLGTVFWDLNGIPTRLDLDDGGVVHFTESGGVDRVVGGDADE